MTQDTLTLTSELDRWQLTLHGGEVLTVFAHGVKEQDGRYVFVALMRGKPHFEAEICSVPMSLVANLLGG